MENPSLKDNNPEKDRETAMALQEDIRAFKKDISDATLQLNTILNTMEIALAMDDMTKFEALKKESEEVLERLEILKQSLTIQSEEIIIRLNKDNNI